MAKKKDNSYQPTGIQPGEEISFSAIRITRGNPVTGIYLSEDEQNITVRLTKDIEGVTTTWDKGAERTFDKSLIGRISRVVNKIV